ncbi:hypothetical protein LEMLEM_LOCUS20629, partial [Lemmus lemmus]
LIKRQPPDHLKGVCFPTGPLIESAIAAALLCTRDKGDLSRDKNVISQFPAPATRLSRPVAMSSPLQGLYLSETERPHQQSRLGQL